MAEGCGSKSQLGWRKSLSRERQLSQGSGAAALLQGIPNQGQGSRTLAETLAHAIPMIALPEATVGFAPPLRCGVLRDPPLACAAGVRAVLKGLTERLPAGLGGPGNPRMGVLQDPAAATAGTLARLSPDSV
jgi:hypothetical protein